MSWVAAGVSEPTVNRDGGRRYALFPLNVVLFPGGLLPLRIFEPRYQRMVSECLREQRPFIVASIVDGPEAGGVAMTAASGTLTRIVDWEALEDGLLGLLCAGETRVDIDGVEAESDGLLRARATEQPDAAPQSLPAEFGWTAGLLDEILRRLGAPYDRLATVAPTADHVANRLTELLPLPVIEKQRLFELPDGRQRLQRLVELIQSEPST